MTEETLKGIKAIAAATQTQLNETRPRNPFSSESVEELLLPLAEAEGKHDVQWIVSSAKLHRAVFDYSRAYKNITNSQAALHASIEGRETGVDFKSLDSGVQAEIATANALLQNEVANAASSGPPYHETRERIASELGNALLPYRERALSENKQFTPTFIKKALENGPGNTRGHSI